MGYPATFYQIVVDTERLGIVKVYSEGAYANQSGTGSVIDVEMRLRNLSDEPVSLDLSRCDIDAETDRGEQLIAKPLLPARLEPIPPDGVGRIALSYPLEGGIRPDEVSSFDFDWTLDTKDGTYANTTAFVRRMVQNVYRYYPVYGGWWDYPWAWGWGWGWYGGPGLDGAWGRPDQEEHEGGHAFEGHGGGGRRVR